MKEIRQEKIILNEEEMVEVVGGRAVNSFIIPSSICKGIKWWKFSR